MNRLQCRAMRPASAGLTNQPAADLPQVLQAVMVVRGQQQHARTQMGRTSGEMLPDELLVPCSQRRALLLSQDVEAL